MDDIKYESSISGSNVLATQPVYLITLNALIQSFFSIKVLVLFFLNEETQLLLQLVIFPPVLLELALEFYIFIH
jgi:hypothetical protein